MYIQGPYAQQISFTFSDKNICDCVSLKSNVEAKKNPDCVGCSCTVCCRRKVTVRELYCELVKIGHLFFICDLLFVFFLPKVMKSSSCIYLSLICSKR